MLTAGVLVNFTDWVAGFEPVDRLGVVVSSFDTDGETGYAIRDEDGKMYFGIDSQDVWER